MSNSPKFALRLLCVSVVAAQASLGMISSSRGAVTIEFVEVGDPGNAPANVVKDDDLSTGYGRVEYVFQMAKYETTNDQYVEFLNAVAKSDPNSLFHPLMKWDLWGGIDRAGVDGSYVYVAKPHMGNKPVNFVSWYDGARFANWMHNGQPVGPQDESTTEDGAYTFSGPESISGRNSGAEFFLPTEHEWDKAAFYQPGATTTLGDGWWMYPSASDVFPETSAIADEFGNVTNPSPYTINYRQTANWNGSERGNLVTVGSAGNMSYFGAMDMAGNVFEWTLADPEKPDPNGWGPYTTRGGGFTNTGHVGVSERNLVHHDNHNLVGADVGFRLAAPEAGDFDFNGVVDGNDFLVWQRGTSPTPLSVFDLDAWKSKVKAKLAAEGAEGSAEEAQTVPEPASALMLSLVVLSLPPLRRFQ